MSKYWQKHILQCFIRRPDTEVIAPLYESLPFHDEGLPRPPKDGEDAFGEAADGLDGGLKLMFFFQGIIVVNRG